MGWGNNDDAACVCSVMTSVTYLSTTSPTRQSDYKLSHTLKCISFIVYMTTLSRIIRDEQHIQNNNKHT